MAKVIENQTELVEAVKHIASKTSSMSREIIGKDFPITSVTVFSHSPEEFTVLSEILEKLGKPYNYNNGPRITLDNPIETEGNQIIHLRIRKPDPARPQVGCNDFETDYNTFKTEYLGKYPNNLTLIQRPEYDMIELHDARFDVLAYVLSA